MELELGPRMEAPFRETTPIVFSIIDFPHSGSYYSPFARTTMFHKSYGGIELELGPRMKAPFRETMPIVFSIVDFPPSGLHKHQCGRFICFYDESYGGPPVAYVPE